MVGGLMVLIDTNVWLELLLDQEKAEQVRSLFQRIDASLMAISEFSLYSIGIILIRLKKYLIWISMTPTKYVAGSKHDYVLISFDANFDHTIEAEKLRRNLSA